MHVQIQDRDYSSQALALTPYALVVSTICITFGVVILGTLALWGYLLPPANPFLAYVAIFPGQPESALSSGAFSCVMADLPLYAAPLEKDCRFSPPTGTFSRIDVIISNQMIRQTTFVMRENILRVGDVALFVEARDFRAVHSAVYFSWHGNIGIASIIPNTGRFSMFRNVWQVSLTDMIYNPVSEEHSDSSIAGLST